MLHHHPDSLRPDHAAAPFLAAGTPALEDLSIVDRLVTVILRQAHDGQPTELRHFREAEETCGLTDEEIARHIGAARRKADRSVVRQVDETWDPAAERAKADKKARRQSRLGVARQVVLGLFPDAGQVHAALRTAGFTLEEEADLWGELIPRAAEAWRETAGAAA